MTSNDWRRSDRRVSRRAALAGGMAAAMIPGRLWAAPNSVDLDRLAVRAAGNARSATDRIRAIVGWTHENLEWTATDYRSRSVEEIIERGGGNCREQALVVQDFLGRLGIDTRMTREVNVQPANDRRQRDAAALVARQGPRASVFGRRHNDHVWIEYHDRETGRWLPSDPTINIVGLEDWVPARLGFGARPVHDIVPYADMLFPITVLAIRPGGAFESRTAHYLVDGFATYVPGVAAAPGWADWTRLVQTADERLTRSFRGEYDFHNEGPLIGELIAAYAALRNGA